MGSLFVVPLQTRPSDLPYLTQRLEYASIDDVDAVRAIESLIERILLRLVWRNGRSILGSSRQVVNWLGISLGPIAEANSLQLIPLSDDLLQHPNHTLGSERCIDFDGKVLPGHLRVVHFVATSVVNAAIIGASHRPQSMSGWL